MHAVGELDHDDADVAHHGEQHLAEALRLRFLAVFKLYLVELADPVHQFGDHLAEGGRDLRLGRGCVFDDVVQDGRNQGVGVHTQVGKDVGDRHRMGDVRLAGEALLAEVALGAEVVGLAYQLDLGRREVRFELV